MHKLGLKKTVDQCTVPVIMTGCLKSNFYTYPTYMPTQLLLVNFLQLRSSRLQVN